MTKITKKQVCTCEKCGNEAEMVITCHLEDHHTGGEKKEAQPGKSEAKRVKGRATCSHCGNEADIWLEL